MLANVVPNPIGKKAIGLVFRLFNFGAHTTQMTNTPSIRRNQSLGSETTTCPAIIAPNTDPRTKYLKIDQDS